MIEFDCNCETFLPELFSFALQKMSKTVPTQYIKLGVCMRKKVAYIDVKF